MTELKHTPGSDSRETHAWTSGLRSVVKDWGMHERVEIRNRSRLQEGFEVQRPTHLDIEFCDDATLPTGGW